MLQPEHESDSLGSDAVEHRPVWLPDCYGVLPECVPQWGTDGFGTREEAIRKMTAALSELVIGGTLNNIEDQIDIIRDERFKKGDYYTDFMKHFQRPGQ